MRVFASKILMQFVIHDVFLVDPVPHGGDHGGAGVKAFSAYLLEDLDLRARGAGEAQVGDGMEVDDTTDR